MAREVRSLSGAARRRLARERPFWVIAAAGAIGHLAVLAAQGARIIITIAGAQCRLEFTNGQRPMPLSNRPQAGVSVIRAGARCHVAGPCEVDALLTAERERALAEVARSFSRRILSGMHSGTAGV